MAVTAPPAAETPGNFQPAAKLWNRTFVGLLIAQFLAAFNDQAIHASAMFFAINRKTLTEGAAISLMPILFYAPWAIFCTLAGYLADKYSKRRSLVFWKLAEIAITGVATLGFVIGSELNMPDLGVWIVLATVFLMGSHSTFFVPAKYGCMPEILQPQLLSRGNGILESLSFLAIILGTVCGGVLSQVFNGDEYLIGIVLFMLAIVGAVASYLIQEMPAANAMREFPRYIYLPLIRNLNKVAHHRPLTFALVGIAFFTFMVTFMRAAVYMLGESRIPRWNEAKTSEIVGMTALGIGLGSPLAGWLSGKKVELGLVPIGGIGMVVVTCLAAVLLDRIPGLITCIILIGFFTGFYLVPLFTLMQHRAPKEQKGEVVATSNFVNVTGAIAASLLFFVVVWLAQFAGFAPRVDHETFARQPSGNLTAVQFDQHHRPVFVQIADDGVGADVGSPVRNAEVPPIWNIGADEDLPQPNLQIMLSQETQIRWNDHEDERKKGRTPSPIPVRVTRYMVGGVAHIFVRLADEEPPATFDKRELPRYLFIGASAMTVGVLSLLFWLLPDLFRRARGVLRSFGKSRLQVHGIHHLPGHGPTILVYRNSRPENIESLSMASDRHVHAIASDDEKQVAIATMHLRRQNVIAVPHVANGVTAEQFIRRVCSTIEDGPESIVPVYCSVAEVNFGEPLPITATQAKIEELINAAAFEKEE